MSEITVIGLGNMGAALARALLADDWELTVWNRTKSKADPFIKSGAILAQDPASAIQTSPVIIVCVINYDVTHNILSQPGVKESLPGKIIIQLSNGTPREAHVSQDLVVRHQAEYLDGDVMVYPDMVGKPDSEILIAGRKAVFARCEPVLHSLAEKLTYMGEEISAPSAYSWAMGSVLWGTLLGALHGARICEAQGLAIDKFAKRLINSDMAIINGAVKDLLHRINENRFDESQAAINTGADIAERELRLAIEAKINTDFPDYVSKTFKKAIDAGLGDEDLAAYIKVLRDQATNSASEEN